MHFIKAPAIFIMFYPQYLDNVCHHQCHCSLDQHSRAYQQMFPNCYQVISLILLLSAEILLLSSTGLCDNNVCSPIGKVHSRKP